MIDTIERTRCTGCKMCADICPLKAVSYKSDRKGFWYPVVDGKKCSQCGLCVKSCPEFEDHRKADGNVEKGTPIVYAAWVKDEALRFKSTSGGIFGTLAKNWIEAGGYLAGCRYSEDYTEACHEICNTEEALGGLIGSKYLQSDMEGIYSQIKTLLDDGKEVLFSGTPCQSAALQIYLGVPSEHLVTVDFICRGINSPAVYRRYLAELEEKYHSKVKSVHMKNKRLGWSSLGLLVKFQNGKEYFRKGKDDLWVQGYLQRSLFTRPSCHSCRYKALPRISDITLGDFWGIRGMRKEDLFKGISVVMINSKNGAALFDRIMDGISCERRSLDEAIEGNASLTTNNLDGLDSELFFDLLDFMNVSGAVRACLPEQRTGKELLKRLTRGLRRSLRRA